MLACLGQDQVAFQTLFTLEIEIKPDLAQFTALARFADTSSFKLTAPHVN